MFRLMGLRRSFDEFFPDSPPAATIETLSFRTLAPLKAVLSIGAAAMVEKPLVGGFLGESAMRVPWC